mmetsp:Transcript_17770/g.27446  ORF Transcript_17770/g.27446 Transcript_17770/m.27446 type:complete len:745 (+) Transcript_17770:590-2824(+)|eukprot:CAMPEP_0195307628 /NCGR_PEP_ID=MMETSP0707-20130614/37812_1 /TAXON_ID=33640 /ORGANISM="Asterionellopsis glacialis, Strain CCMP134" /LENGTH=744 /DNA_ID=CAMNT_0040371881 /DNA_START=513 /DNA_END=2747 /DNA_ORIENTATION=+
MNRFAASISSPASAAKRKALFTFSPTTTSPTRFSHRNLHSVSVQLDYYMSAQFAGVATAITNNMYEKAGLDLNFLPICTVGQEMRRVRDHADASTSNVTIGSVEQNIFIPTLYDDPTLKVKGVAAMFRKSPLCLASLDPLTVEAPGGKRIVVGAHEDTVSLIKRILSLGPLGGEDFDVIASPRATKNSDLKSGKLDAIQAYLTTEVPTLQRELEIRVVAPPLEGMNGARLGYSQVLFAPEEHIASGDDRREVIQTFLDVTFKGWDMAIRDNEAAASSVEECKAQLGLDDEKNDHWDKTFSYTIQNVGLCCDAVKETFQGDKFGVLNAARWNEATDWLLDTNTPPSADFGLDSSIWQPSPQLISGNEIARTTLEEAKKSAARFLSKHGRKPSLAVITIGELPRYLDEARRLQIYSNSNNSWFSKEIAGDANGFAVKEINLSQSTTTYELLSQLYALKDVDGIQLMWPLPSHIDAVKCYNAIGVSQDVDGAHFIGQSELDPTKAPPLPPVTPAAVMALVEEYGIDLKNSSVLVVGRSRIVGAPLAYMANRAGGVVTVAHSETSPEKLKQLVGSADVILACAGSPGLLKADWVKTGANIINVGTTFVKEKDALCPDFEGDLSSVAGMYSPTPGGVGPLSNAHLFKNVAQAAWNNAELTGDLNKTWSKKSEALERTIHFASYDDALAFAQKINEMSREMDHHANMSFKHHCVDGVDVSLELFTFEANKLTEKDYEAAKKINDIASELN